MELKEIYDDVRNIVLRCYHDYHLHGWEQEDWEQEAFIILHLLIESHPEVIEDGQKLYPYFKTKYKNYILDQLRKQESKKRKFNKPNYEEIGEIAHCIKKKGLNTDDFVLLKEDLERFYKKASKDEKEKIAKLMAGERFVGRKELIKKLKKELKDHNPYKK